MKKSHHVLTEHYLVPATLFLLNISLAHVIYAFMAESTYSTVGKIAVTVSFVLMGGSLFYKKQLLLAGSMLLYLLVALTI